MKLTAPQACLAVFLAVMAYSVHAQRKAKAAPINTDPLAQQTAQAIAGWQAQTIAQADEFTTSLPDSQRHLRLF